MPSKPEMRKPRQIPRRDRELRNCDRSSLYQPVPDKPGTPAIMSDTPAVRLPRQIGWHMVDGKVKAYFA